jgi:beta-lactamase class A
MLKALRRLLVTALLVLGGAYLLYQGFLFWRAQDKLPPGTRVAGVEVDGLTVDGARQAILDQYMSPIAVYGGDERAAELAPGDVGFSIDVDAMLAKAQAEWESQETWRRYAEFALGISPRPIDVPLMAHHDEQALNGMLERIAAYLDRPTQGPQLLSDTGEIAEGKPGRMVDRPASLQALRTTLYDPAKRAVSLTLVDLPAPEWNIEVLRQAIENELAAFDGFASVFVVDLQTGEEMGINSDVAVSGLSILKIPIFIEAYRKLDQPPNAFEEDLFLNTATASSNHSANLLLHIIAGEDNTYEGASDFTQAMRDLGLVNTFMAVPYDAATVPTRPSTFDTPANQRTDINTLPDPTMQTTAEDIGTILSMLYYCAKGEGGLLAVYPDEITQEECQAIIDLMIKNTEGNLIRFGVPDDVRVSHKHGWSFNEHGDAGIVFTPGGDYVLYTLLAQPEADWLSSDYSFPILREISRAVYNYFNHDDPFMGRPEEESATAGGT